MKKNTHKSNKSPSLIRQALKVNRNPFPWFKAFRAGLAAGLPVLIGLLLGNLQYGLTAALGGFTYLYVFNVPYAQRAKKIFFVVVAMTLIAALGTLAAPYPLMVAILMGIIGATAVFIFGALKISGPSAIFFVLVFAMITGMLVDQDAFLIRAGLVFSGGALSWVIAMIDWFFNPHGPETGVVKRAYLGLASLLDAVGTEDFNEEKHRVMSVLKEAEETLAAGYIPWRTTDLFNRLYILNDHASVIFTYIIENFADRETPLPKELAESFRVLANSIDMKNKNERISRIISHQAVDDEAVAKLYTKIYDQMPSLMSRLPKSIRSSAFPNRQSGRFLLALWTRIQSSFCHP
ncbi:FUSC family membrane protein [Lentibacillus jeotgali]|uniref:FUSC family membrane protein n=1 Tax=Lentibacillus jeotgali TaxID=558169 RepID=UPI000315063E|nr:FUSC family membrane protein [Lentibacillus jeotgali]